MASPLVQALAYQDSVKPVPSSVSPTNVVGAYQLASNVAEQNYQAQLAKQNAFWGGLAGLGGAGVLAFGRPAASKLFGAGPGTTPAAGATNAAASPLAAATAPGGGGILTGGDALGLSPSAFAAQPGLAAAGDGSGILTGSSALGLSPDAFAAQGPLASLLGSSAAPSVAGDFGLAGAGSAGADAAGSVAADLGASGAADAGTAALADAGSTAIPDFLAALLAMA